MLRYVPGTGVVMSAGVYLSETGNTGTSGERVSSDGANLRIPRPFVVVASGKTTTVRVGFWRTRFASVVAAEGGNGGVRDGERNALRMAARSGMGVTFGVDGCEQVNIGSKIAAR